MQEPLCDIELSWEKPNKACDGTITKKAGPRLEVMDGKMRISTEGAAKAITATLMESKKSFIYKKPCRLRYNRSL